MSSSAINRELVLCVCVSIVMGLIQRIEETTGTMAMGGQPIQVPMHKNPETGEEEEEGCCKERPNFMGKWKKKGSTKLSERIDRLVARLG